MGMDRAREPIYESEDRKLRVAWVSDSEVQVRHKQRGSATISCADDMYLLRGVLPQAGEREMIEEMVEEALESLWQQESSPSTPPGSEDSPAPAAEPEPHPTLTTEQVPEWDFGRTTRR